MRVGSVVYSTDQGLGILAKSFWDNGVLTDVTVQKHKHHRNYLDRYPGAKVASHHANRELCDRVDVMLFFETPFDWGLIEYCRHRGVRTALMLMHECTPAELPARPDLFLAPSALEAKEFPGSKFLPVPVEAPWRMRKECRTYVHNAGHGGLKGRNGTQLLLEAMRHVRSPLKLIVRSQKPLAVHCDDERVELRIGTADYSSLWDEGDCFVFPEKFNGLSLPLQEARAAGMLVMATARFPNWEYLPYSLLIPSRGSARSRIGPAYREFDEAVVDPSDIAATMDKFYGKDIAEYSCDGLDWAASMSWQKLKPLYLEALCA